MGTKMCYSGRNNNFNDFQFSMKGELIKENRCTPEFVENLPIREEQKHPLIIYDVSEEEHPMTSLNPFPLVFQIKTSRFQDTNFNDQKLKIKKFSSEIKQKFLETEENNNDLASNSLSSSSKVLYNLEI